MSMELFASDPLFVGNAVNSLATSSMNPMISMHDPNIKPTNGVTS